jgi:hypothetical protein
MTLSEFKFPLYTLKYFKKLNNKEKKNGEHFNLDPQAHETKYK